ncbi:MAG: hypothetical protein GX094_06285 [Clostridiales bacterium]|jgi:hypothetical protein|nr:hypothetical protein [Clostridiales bacterium]
MVYVDFDHEIPRYVYTGCANCSSVMGISMCSITNRGCCYYYPKYTLVDIQKMARTLEGLTFLNSIIQLPTREVEPFRIIAKGYFDRKSYNEYIMGKNRLNISNIQDHSIFFKACPFVKSGFGCTLPPRYRTYVCNFFLCDEIIQSIKTKNCFEVYIRERERYVRWIEWENTSLMKILQEYKVDLIKDWEGSIRILQDIPLNIYEFPKLHPIVVDTGSSRGA